MTEPETETKKENVSKTVEPEVAPAKKKIDPVRKWTGIVLLLCVLSMAWYLRSDRITPYTSQAKLHALIVPISPEISGTIISVAVNNNQRVSSGDALFQIEPRDYEIAIHAAEADLESAHQSLGASGASVDAAKASLDSAIANSDRASKDYLRLKRIREEDPGAISARRLESAEAGLASAQGQVDAAQANLARTEKELGAEGEKNSRIQKAQAALDKARLGIQRTAISAPENGVVTGVRLDTGSFAAAGQPQLTFISTSNIWIQADFTENNLGHLKAGDPVDVVFDVLPGDVFTGTVREIAFGVAIDSNALGSLPTVDNERQWLRDAQRFPVLVDFTIAEEHPGRDLLKVGSQVSLIVYTGDNKWFNQLGRLRIRVASYLTYLY